jgi:hypothetical protein
MEEFNQVEEINAVMRSRLKGAHKVRNKRRQRRDRGEIERRQRRE